MLWLLEVRLGVRATEDLVHVCPNHSLHLPVSVYPALFHINLYSSSLFCLFHGLQYITSSSGRWGGGAMTDIRTSLNVSLLSALTHYNAMVEIFLLWLIGSALLKRVATSACACKLVFRDQGWLILHYEDEGELDLKGWVNLVHILFSFYIYIYKILYKSVPALNTVTCFLGEVYIMCNPQV